MSSSEKSTPVSILDRARDPKANEDRQRLLEYCLPYLLNLAKRIGVKDAHEREELVQETGLVILKELESFEYNPEKTFRGWLRTIMVRKRNERWRRAGVREFNEQPMIEEPAVAEDVEFEEREYRTFMIQQAFKRVEANYSERDQRVLKMEFFEAKTSAEIAKELKLKVATVYQVKSRILRALRAELEGLVDDL